MKLAIDTSHYVAVGIADDHGPLESVVLADTRAHLEHVIPLTVQLLDKHQIRWDQIEAIAVGMGPGPYTGLRVGIAAARTLAAVGKTPELRVCSLDVIATQWVDAPEEYIVASDARRKELYWAHYQHGRRVGAPRVSTPDHLPALPVAGAVPEPYRELLDWRLEGPQTLNPAMMAAVAADLPAAPSEPFYLRPADATVSGAPKSALPRLRAVP